MEGQSDDDLPLGRAEGVAALATVDLKYSFCKTACEKKVGGAYWRNRKRLATTPLSYLSPESTEWLSVPKKAKEKMAIYQLFLQHIISSLKPGGKAAVVVPTGFITAQNGIDKGIRQHLVDKKMLAGVVGSRQSER
jgi:hypothetical protein